MSKYLFIIFHKGDEDDDDRDICWIRSPNTNDDVPIRKETIVRIFWVMAGISTIGIFVSVRELSANTYEVNRLDMTNWISKKTITEPEVNWDPTTWGNLWLFCRFRTVSFTPKCEIDILCRIYHQSFLRLLGSIPVWVFTFSTGYGYVCRIFVKSKYDHIFHIRMPLVYTMSQSSRPKTPWLSVDLMSGLSEEIHFFLYPVASMWHDCEFSPPLTILYWYGFFAKNYFEQWKIVIIVYVLNFNILVIWSCAIVKF